MDELLTAIKEISEGTLKNDKALLELCERMIEKLNEQELRLFQLEQIVYAEKAADKG